MLVDGVPKAGYFEGRVSRCSTTSRARFPSSAIVCDVLGLLPGAPYLFAVRREFNRLLSGFPNSDFDVSRTGRLVRIDRLHVHHGRGWRQRAAW